MDLLRVRSRRAVVCLFAAALILCVGASDPQSTTADASFLETEALTAINRGHSHGGFHEFKQFLRVMQRHERARRAHDDQVESQSSSDGPSAYSMIESQANAQAQAQLAAAVSMPIGYGTPFGPNSKSFIPVVPGGQPSPQSAAAMQPSDPFAAMNSVSSAPNGAVARMLTDPGPTHKRGMPFPLPADFQFRSTSYPQFRQLSQSEAPAPKASAAAPASASYPEVNPSGIPMPFYAPMPMLPLAPNQVPSTTYMVNNVFANSNPQFASFQPSGGESSAGGS